MRSATSRRRAHPRLIVVGAIALLLAGIVPAQAAGTLTRQASMLTAVGTGVTVTPIIAVGEAAGDDGYRFESIPDGISLTTRGRGTAEVYVNHETSTVPFPYNPTAPRTSARATSTHPTIRGAPRRLEV